MLIHTKHFGEINLEEDKIIFFDNGIMGYENYKKYAILYNQEDGEKRGISWLQSLEEQELALPVINPFMIREDYNPEVEDDLLVTLGDIREDNSLVLVSITVTHDVQSITANLKAPFIINTESRKGAQLIAQNSEYEIKYNIAELIKLSQTKEGERKC